MFEWLKIIVTPKPSPGKAPPPPQSVIRIDSRSYPLAALNKSGFVAGGFDDTVIEGQMAKIVVDVNDPWGKFAFKASVTIDKVIRDKGQFSASWQVLPTEVEAVLVRYAQLKKGAAAPPRRTPAR